MTQGEKMVWAAVFAKGYQKAIHPDPHIALFDDEHKKIFYQGCLEEAIGDACSAIRRLRAEGKRLENAAWCEEDVANMLEEMLK